MCKTRATQKRTVTIATALLAIMPVSASAQIITDGSLGSGPAGALTPGLDATITIPAELGATVCNDANTSCNVFHSFSEFNVNAGQTAAFTGPIGIDPGAVNNVLARVTGSSVSNIDGVLSTSAMPNANFFLMNPNGVVFGPGAQLDIGGSFVVTTANELRLADGQVFAAMPDAGTDAMLTTAAPSAFGFLNQQVAPVSISPQTFNFPIPLSVDPGRMMTIISGPIQIVGRVVAAPAGQVNLVSVGSPGQVQLTTDPLAPIDVEGVSQLSSINLIDGAAVVTDGPGGGQINVLAENLNVFGSIIRSRADALPGGGSLPSGGMNIHLRGTLTVLGGLLETTSQSTATGGDINITAESIILSLGGFITSTVEGTGDGGDVHLAASSISIMDVGGVVTNPFMPDPLNPPNPSVTGQGGDITISADMVLIAGLEDVDAPFDTQITGLVAGAEGHERGGSITVTTPHLQMTNVAVISAPNAGDQAGGNITLNACADTAETQTCDGVIDLDRGVFVVAGANVLGTSGDVNVVTGTLRLSGSSHQPIEPQFIPGFTQTIFVPTTIGSITAGGGGPTGNVTVTASVVEVLDGANLNANTSGIGNGGNLTMNISERLLVSGFDPDARELDSERGLDPRRAGSTVVGTSALNFLRPDTGSAGTVQINASGAQVVVRDQGIIATETQTTGNSGTIGLSAERIFITDGGFISARSSSELDGAGLAGQVTLTASDAVLLRRGGSVTTEAVIAIAGTIEINAGTSIEVTDSTVSAQAGIDGGNIKLTAPDEVRIVDSTITGQAVGDGGRIDIDPQFVILQNSIIDGRAGGEPVRVTIDPNAIFLNSHSQILTDAASLPPELDLSGSLSNFPVSLINNQVQLQSSCAVRFANDVSSFTLDSQGGLPLRVDGWVPGLNLARLEGGRHRRPDPLPVGPSADTISRDEGPEHLRQRRPQPRSRRSRRAGLPR